MAGIIGTNAIITFMQLEWDGLKVGAILGEEEAVSFGDSKEIARFFRIIEELFNLFYVCELVLRVGVKRLEYFIELEPANWVDILVVGFGLADVLMNRLGHDAGTSLAFMRLARMFRLARVARVGRALNFLRPIRVLVKTIKCSLAALFWSLMLLCVIMFMNAILISQTVGSVVKERSQAENVLEETRTLYQAFGTASRTLYTTFALTFSGGWPNFVRPLVEGISWWYAAYFCVYVYVVIFAIFRVITALFLRETLQTAAHDSDIVVQERTREMKHYVQHLKELFKRLDEDGNGVVTKDEFLVQLDRPEARTCLTLLGLTPFDLNMLFDLMDDGDGYVDHQEFFQGILRLKGQARSADLMAMFYELKRMHSEHAVVGRMVLDLSSKVSKCGLFSTEQSVQDCSLYAPSSPNRLEKSCWSCVLNPFEKSCKGRA